MFAIADVLVDTHDTLVADVMHLIVDWSGASRARFDAARDLGFRLLDGTGFFHTI